MSNEAISRSPRRALEAAEILKAVAHPLRLQIVAILCERDEHVNGLAERLGVKQPIVSQQLRILRMRGLVEAVRTKGYARYRLVEPQLKKMIGCMENCVGRREA